MFEVPCALLVDNLKIQFTFSDGDRMLSRSLDALIGFLLDEIALSGEQGEYSIGKSLQPISIHSPILRLL